MTLTKKSHNAIIKGILTRKSPIYVQFAVSKACNLRCKMCGAVDARKHEKELDLDQIKQLADVLDKLGVGVLILTGGEPTLRPDIFDIIKIFAKKGFDLKLQTNGIGLTESDVMRLLDPDGGIKDVTISLDTLDAKKQDYICGKKGTFDEIIRSIALFSKFLPKQGNMSMINTVVSNLNYMDVIDVINFVDAIGFYSSLIPVHLSTTDGFIVRKESREFAFNKDDHHIIDSLYKSIIKMKREGFNVHNSYKFLKACPDFLKYGKISWKCDSPYLYFSVSPNGTFLPCVDLKGYKNMLDDDFLEHYSSWKEELRLSVIGCKGCMYACYPEVSGFIKNPFTLMERMLQNRKIEKFKRRIYSYEEMKEIIKEIRRKAE